ncbi:MAG: type II toxin-antitoxin system Phd/YefM family antitoxin [Chloroflexota bacterium]|nr:MAG: type II toxin-antitoxin system Phd/YefM family antitoxin [Chloroflexota bacterium]
MIETTYSDARAHLARYLDRASDDREVIIVQRRGRPPVAMIDADELTSLLETAHLMASPANASRLLAALERAERSAGTRLSIDELRRDIGLNVNSA